MRTYPPPPAGHLKMHRSRSDASNIPYIYIHHSHLFAVL